MELYTYKTAQPPVLQRPRSVALGFFDGVHPGHRRVIEAAAQGRTEGAVLCVYTFDTATFTAKGLPGLLCEDEEEARLLEELGVEELFRADFSAVCHLTPEQFVQQVLHRQLGAVRVTCGFNYRFGVGGAGDAALLETLCAAYGIAVTVVPEVVVDGIPVSSTAIRQAIAAGDMDTARRLLGRPYGITAPVVEGRRLGRTLGVPTINQPLNPRLVHPRYGVYASRVEIGSVPYPAVTNIGVKPTVGADAPLAETYILGYEGDLYGAAPTVYPVKFIRPEQTFASLEALQAQIRQDADTAAALLEMTRT